LSTPLTKWKINRLRIEGKGKSDDGHDTGSTLGLRWIINLPTKKSWRQPSRLEWVRTGLDSLVEEVQRLGIQSLRGPRVGL
jgi:hypothetical protein